MPVKLFLNAPDRLGPTRSSLSACPHRVNNNGHLTRWLIKLLPELRCDRKPALAAVGFVLGLQQGRQVPESLHGDLSRLEEVDKAVHPLSPRHRAASERFLF
jgi:hypothetical protein